MASFMCVRSYRAHLRAQISTPVEPYDGAGLRVALAPLLKALDAYDALAREAIEVCAAAIAASEDATMIARCAALEGALRSARMGLFVELGPDQTPAALQRGAF